MISWAFKTHQMEIMNLTIMENSKLLKDAKRKYILKRLCKAFIGKMKEAYRKLNTNSVKHKIKKESELILDKLKLEKVSKVLFGLSTACQTKSRIVF